MYKGSQKTGRRNIHGGVGLYSPYENISILCKGRKVKEALEILHVIDKKDFRAAGGVYAFLLEACADLKSLSEGKRIHAYMIKTGCDPSNFVKTKLLAMYAKCHCVADARQVFDKMPEPNFMSWNAMMTGYAQNGRMKDARQVFDRMPKRNVVSWNAMVSGYVQNGKIDDARQLFDKMPERNVVSWNALIAGYVLSELGSEVLRVFCEMRQIGMKPNQSTFSTVLCACAGIADLEQGKLVHALVIKMVSEPDVFVGSALIDMYSKCRSIDDACMVFDQMQERNVVSWTAMVVAYVQNGRIEDASQIFENMPERNFVTWSAMITGYTQAEYYEESLKLFLKMQQASMKLNQCTLSSVVSACANLATLEQGKQIHGLVIKLSFESDILVESALIDMYSKSGNIDSAHYIFDNMSDRNIVSWTAMISGYAQHGFAYKAVQLFEQMQREGIRPNHITFIAILSACSHGGLTNEGWHYFDSMVQDHCIGPSMEHYACMVDLLCRSGLLHEAEYFISKMPFEPDAFIWGILLGACRSHMNPDVGKLAAEHLFLLEPDNTGAYVLLSNIYAAAGMWDDVAKVRMVMKNKELKQTKGCSWIEIKNRVHVFHVGDG
jgi:pentatricopeptide repeat protein